MSATVAILGGGQSDFARNWTREQAPLPELLGATIKGGLAETGLDFADLAAVARAGRLGAFVGNFAAPKFLNQGHLGAFLTEVDPVFYGVPAARYEAACASGSVALHAAATAIRAGDLDLALVVGVELMKSANPAAANDYLGLAADYEREARGVPFVFPRVFGRLTDLLIENEGDETGTMAALDEIARINTENGKRNPYGQLRDEDSSPERLARLNQRFAASLGGRTRYSDSAQITDGGAVLLLASADFTREYLRRAGRTEQDIALLSGWGHRTAPLSFATKFESTNGGGARSPHEGTVWTRQAIQDAYRRAEVRADDVDVFETHDCFSVSEYLAFAAFGLCERGGEKALLESGAVARGGGRPVNPSGGLIGAGHPVGATGVRMALDLWRQVTGRAGATQVEGARTGAMLNIGGSFTTSFSFVLSRAEQV